MTKRRYLAALTLLLLCLALGACQPVHAQWVPCDASGNVIPHPYTDNNGCYPMYVTMSGNGSGSQTPNNVPTRPSCLYSLYPPGTITVDPYTDDDDSTASGAEAFNGWYSDDSDPTTYVTSSANVNTSYSWVAYFVWQGQSPPPPGPADFLLVTTVAADAERSTAVGYGPPGMSASASASDQFGESESATYAGASYLNNVMNGRHLVPASVSGQGSGSIATVTLTGNVQASASNSSTVFPNGYAIWVSGGGYAGGGVKPDNRAVTISCPSVEQSYYKGADDTSGEGYQAPHLPGSYQADSVVQWQSSTDTTGASTGLPQGWVANNIPFLANAHNFNNPYYSWSVSGAGTLAGPTQGYNTPSVTINPTQFSLLEATGSSFPVTSTVNVSVSDTDEASGTGSYSVTWHLPYEATTLYNTTHTKHTVGDPRVGPVAPGDTLLVQASEAQDVDVSAVFDAGASLTAEDPEVAGLFAIASSIAKITDTKYSYGGEASYNGASNTPGSGNWGLAVNDMNEVYQGSPNINPPSLASDPTNYGLCYLYIYVVENDTDRYWYADGYNAHGFDGNSQHTLDVHQCDLIESEPYFVQYKNPDGSPHNPS